MVQGHIGVVFVHLGDDVFPELEGFQHIGFVHTGDTLAALAGGFERHAGNAFHLGAAVTHGVKSFLGTGEGTVRGDTAATRLAKINITRQLADDEDVQTGHQLGLQAGRVHQFFVADGGAEVGKQAEVFAQTQNGLFGAQWAVEGVVFPVANSAKQNRIGFFGQLQGALGQRVTMGVVSRATHQGAFHLEFQVQRIQDLDGLRDDFGANAVSGQNCNFHTCCLKGSSWCGPTKVWWPGAGLQRL